MNALLEIVHPSSLLIVGGVGCYVIGFLFRDQLHIRLLVFIGSIFYGAYYLTAASTPLWDAILGIALVGAASLQGAIQILWSRSMLSAPPESRRVLRLLGDIEPGLFNRLMRIGERMDITEPQDLTVEGMEPDALWLLLEGEIVLRRKGLANSVIGGPCFVGEIAWLTRGPASATTTAHPGARVLRWPHHRLRRSLRRNHRLELGLEALIAQDLARKLSRSLPVNEAPDLER